MFSLLSRDVDFEGQSEEISTKGDSSIERSCLASLRKSEQERQERRKGAPVPTKRRDRNQNSKTKKPTLTLQRRQKSPKEPPHRSVLDHRDVSHVFPAVPDRLRELLADAFPQSRRGVVDCDVVLVK